MPYFKDLVDMGHLYKVARVVEIEKNIGLKKLYQSGTISDIKNKIANEATEKTKILQDIIGKVGARNYENSGSLLNSVVQIHFWVKDNIKKLTNRDSDLRNVLINMGSLCFRIKKNLLNKFISSDIEKAGQLGRSGRKPGYQFKELEHPRGQGGKFTPGRIGSGKKVSRHQYMTVEGGKKLPSYEIVGGKRVGRGIKVVPEEPSMATARMLGHVTRGMYERTTTDPFKAALTTASRIGEKQNRDVIMIESLRRELQNPRLTNIERKKIMSMMDDIKQKSSTPFSVISQLGQQIKGGGRAFLGQTPYSLTVGAVEGALRGLMERFRSNPYLAPIDVRVRPEILESGIRTAVVAMKRTNAEHIANMLDNSIKTGKTLSVEEYGQLAALSKMPSNKKNYISRLATSLNDIRNDPNANESQKFAANKMERQIHQTIEDHIVSSVIRASEHHTPYAVRRQLERAKGRANLPIYNLTPGQKKHAEELLLNIKGKK